MDLDKKLKGVLRRRTFLKRTACAAAAGALSMPWIKTASAQEFAGKELRVLTWSDPTGQAAVRNILRPFETETGARIKPDLTGTTSDMIAKIRASAARPQYDLVILSGFGASTLAEAGLLEEPNWEQIPNSQDLSPQYQSGAKGYGVGYFLWSDGLLYSTSVYDHAPKSYQVLWSEESRGGVIVVPPQSLGAMELIIIAAKMAGGDAKNPDAGFKLLAELKDRILTVENNPTRLVELFRANSAITGALYSPLLYAEYIPDPEYKLSSTLDLEEGFFVDLQLMVIPKGHPGDRTAINALINKALDPEVQGKMAEEVWYGPTNTKAVLSGKAKAIPYIPSPDVIANRAVSLDADYLASVRDEWVRRYTQAIS
ncbi:MAG: extracellular solute-binding protein [Mesorhizobium sp.]|nr:MAG: extracellular solute-binding protein [Mesorhizobium sp.]TJW58569.1 MAG: extracellular solute-binding protein [Mesorhizobium sp.]